MANRDVVVTMAKRMLKDSIWKSTIIEGLNMTFPIVEAILDNTPVEMRPSDITFVINMKRAWEFCLILLIVEMTCQCSGN